MSFGLSVSDITTLVSFAWNTYKSAKSASASFAEVSREVLSLHTVLQEVLDDASDSGSALSKGGPARREEFQTITGNCTIALTELDNLVKKYKSFGTNSQRTWDRVKFGQEELDGIRSKLTLHVQTINLFLTSLHGGVLSRIERKIDALVAEINSGQREPSVLTVTEEDEGEDVWQMLKSELLEEGITSDDIERCKGDIKAYIRELMGSSPRSYSPPVGGVSNSASPRQDNDAADYAGPIPQRRSSASLTNWAQFPIPTHHGPLQADYLLDDKAREQLNAVVNPTPGGFNAPIKFIDAVGRKFTFPWQLCKSWKGMEELIKQAFLHVDVIGPHVHDGHYDLVGPDGAIILPQIWEAMIQPGWSIKMHMWPMPEPPPPPPPPPLPEYYFSPGMKMSPPHGGKKIKGSKKKITQPGMIPPPPPPPPSPPPRRPRRPQPPSQPPPPPPPPPGFEAIIINDPPPPPPPTPHPWKKKQQPLPGMLRWAAGGAGRSQSLKRGKGPKSSSPTTSAMRPSNSENK